MQAFANVASQPVRKETKSGGKPYWEFRAAESAKNEGKSEATWYTVRVFQEADPGFSKGDFVRLVGKLKLDVFMGREGKPMGVLVVMCYEAKRYDKTAPGNAKSEAGSSTSRTGAGVAMPSAGAATGAVTKAIDLELEDESWLALVG
ncbi:hypothetical protein WDZ92_26980 [Nostoc sp. NIES-2111]